MNIYEVRISGTCQGVPVSTNIQYASSVLGIPSDRSAANLAMHLQLAWRGLIKPLVSSMYRVINYSVKKIEGTVVIPIDEDDPASTPLAVFRYSEQIDLPAGGDAGDVAPEDCHPSFVAVGFKKKCGPLKDQDDLTVALSKSTKGAMRIPGVSEASTTAPLGGNELGVAALGRWAAVGEGLRSLGGGAYLMCVASTTLEISDELESPALSGHQYAMVTSMVPKPLLTSQLSRKQRK